MGSPPLRKPETLTPELCYNREQPMRATAAMSAAATTSQSLPLRTDYERHLRFITRANLAEVCTSPSPILASREGGQDRNLSF